VIYIDSSVLLADLFAESRSPPASLWDEDLASSRLLAYEVWNRINARGTRVSHSDRAGGLLARIILFELNERFMARALEPWPVPLRTLDALHLATVDYLRRQGEAVELASYDSRMIAAAQALGFAIAAL
jgi:predicted nucleic acid-binding protein